MSTSPKMTVLGKHPRANGDVDFTSKRAKLTAYVSKTAEYGWKDVHEDLEKENQAGTYGGANAAYHGLAELRGGVDMNSFHKKRSPHEFYVKSLSDYIKLPQTQKHWDHICTFDPLGLFSTRPTMAATTARMEITELIPNLEADGVVVNEDKSINIIKCAIDYAWNLPALSERLGMEESDVRSRLHKYTLDKTVQDPTKKTYLPPVGGITVYFFGDISKLEDKKTEVAVRVHDSCCGSDVFGTDICTCRPYLMFSVQGAVECAQRGGVGIVAYFQKEGRSLGEVTKFRVYNARKKQPGGDTAEQYFAQTESIAGIRDARFQEMMPDVLLWLGITRIDWLMSMSSDKYDAIVARGIQVMQRVSLPDMYVPAGATVEITAKIASGYHTDTIASEDIISDLRGLEVVRERSKKIYDMVEQQPHHFKIDTSKLPQVADAVIETTKRHYPDLNVPYHGRLRHFDQKALADLTESWPVDAVERARRTIDLITVSVLVDAGAGPLWKYVDAQGNEHRRSEGLAIASFEMFKSGIFSSDVAVPHRVNAHGLATVTQKDIQHGFQVSNSNPMVGVKGRYGILHQLSEALRQYPEYFGKEVCRPGHVVDYVLKHVKDNHVSIKVLWKALIEGLETIWPENMAGVRRGDVWVFSPLKEVGQPGSDMIPFHKLTQWLTYSLLEPIEGLGIVFDDMDLLTGLPEYRNGGLLVDYGVLVPTNPDTLNVHYDVGSELIVEWRALTVILLDKIHELILKKLGKTKEQFPLARVLQGGTWTAGREIAKKKRPDTGSPPIVVRLDGTVF